MHQVNMHQIIKASDYRIMPWKNGLGSTVEIAIEPPDASASGDFNWRLSVATIGASGPFSSFPGFDRILVPLSGGSVELAHGESAPAVKLAKYEPYKFKGEWETQCNIDAEVARDFNVMVKRLWGKAQVKSLQLEPDGQITISSNAGIFFLFCIDSPLRLSIPKEPGDLLVDSEESMKYVNPKPGTTFSLLLNNGQRAARILTVELSAVG